MSDVITVAADGAVTVERRGGVEERRLDDRKLAELTGLLAGQEFAALPADVVGSPVADAFTYAFRHGGHRVRAETPAWCRRWTRSWPWSVPDPGSRGLV
ncbi:hypothetical protein E1265_22625 [Streptomyces sp. 8K308]|nr:hypothetical protein E1265_22625 [Streptomyces sp. 8K308]